MLAGSGYSSRETMLLLKINNFFFSHHHRTDCRVLLSPVP